MNDWKKEGGYVRRTKRVSIAEICEMERYEAAEVMFAERWMENDDALTEEEVTEGVNKVEYYEEDSKDVLHAISLGHDMYDESESDTTDAE